MCRDKKSVLDCMRDRHVGTCTCCLLAAFHQALSLHCILSEVSDSALNSVLWFTLNGAETQESKVFFIKHE